MYSNWIVSSLVVKPSYAIQFCRVAVCSFVERTYIAKERGRVAPLSAYPLLTFCLMSSSALSNLALNFINFPTKVVFRSCKLIPTMAVASVIHRKVFTLKEYCCALAICAGLVMFAAADWQLSPSFHPVGLTLVSLSVCADAILPNAQERLFRLGSSRLEVTFFTNIFTLMVMTFTTLLSGDLIGIIQFARKTPRLQLYMVVYTFIAYIAISVHMTVVKRFGGVTAVLVATVRKAMTLVLSFIIFPKKFSWFYVLGAGLVLGGLTVSSLAKMDERRQQTERQKQFKSHQSDVESGGSRDSSKNEEDQEDVPLTEANFLHSEGTPRWWCLIKTSISSQAIRSKQILLVALSGIFAASTVATRQVVHWSIRRHNKLEQLHTIRSSRNPTGKSVINFFTMVLPAVLADLA